MEKPGSNLRKRHQGDGQTILLVEDDPDVRAFVAAALHSLGYRITEAGDGETALQILASDPDIALLFSDIALAGGMSGMQLAKLARKRRPTLKLLLMSGNMPDLSGTEHEFGADFWTLLKPFRVAELGAKLDLVFPIVS